MSVPKTDNAFTNYLTTTQVYLNTNEGGTLNYARLGQSVAEYNIWYAYAVVTWPALWEKVNNATERTPAIITQKEVLKNTIINFITPLLFRMAGSPNVNATDKLVLRLPAIVRTRVPRPAIETAPNTSMSPLEGATILMSNRVDKSSKRDKIHPAADALEMLYKIGGTPPNSPLECNATYMSSKAKFIFNGGMNNDGKKLYAYTRWVNLSDQSKNGPFSPLVMVTISAGTPEVQEVQEV